MGNFSWVKTLFAPASEYVDPYQRLMANRYLEQNPQADFGGVPGYDQIQREFEAKMQQTGGPLYSAKKDKEGKVTGYSPKSKEERLMQQTGPNIGMGPQGFREDTPSTKEHIFQKIQRKKEIGIPLTNLEQKFEMSYLGADERSPSFEEDLRNTMQGKHSYDDLKDKYPDKAGVITKKRVDALSPKNQRVLEQINGHIKTATTPQELEAVTYEALSELIGRKKEAKEKGINVDELLDILGIDESEIESGDKRSLMDKIRSAISFLTD